MIGSAKFNKLRCYLRLKFEVVSSINFFVLAVNEDDYFDPDRHAAPVVVVMVSGKRNTIFSKAICQNNR